MNITNIVTSKANKYIHAESIKKQHEEHVISNGTSIGKIRTPFGTSELYALMR